MREILFRGKSNDGDWVYGYINQHRGDSILDCKYEQINGGDFYIYDYAAKIDTGIYGLLYKVIPETIGQFTGLTDKNGKRIFEGDIVATKYKLGHGGYYVFEVYYNENLCQFALTINSGSYTKNKQYDWLQLTELKANKIEVIGNIHDNPEILKGGGDNG